MVSVILACGASLAWGSSDFLASVSCRRLRLLVVLLASQLLGLALLLPPLILARTPPPALEYCALAGLAGLLNALALAAFYRALARGPIGLVAPIVATEGIIPLAVGLWEGDRPTAVSMAGIVIALAGTVVAARPRRQHGEHKQDSSHLPTIALATAAAVCFGFFVVALKNASQASPLWAVTFSRMATVTLFVGALLVTSRGAAVPDRIRPRALRARLATVRGYLPALVAIGALDVGASALFANASTSGALSVIGVLGSYYPVVTIVLAGVFLRERLGSWQRLGTLGALTGAALIAVH